MLTKQIKRHFNGKYRNETFGLCLVQTERGTERIFFQKISRKGDVQYWRELKPQNHYLLAELSAAFQEELRHGNA